MAPTRMIDPATLRLAAVVASSEDAIITETLDGSAWILGPDVHRAQIGRSGVLLVALSFAALVAAGYLL